MNVYIIRHGESVWNREQRVQGKKDPGLSVKGMRQASALAVRLKREGIDIIYSSDLKRCCQTSQIISRLTGAPIKYCRGIEEIVLGVWQGKTIEEIKRIYPGTYKTWLRSPSKARIPGWEGVPRFRKRVLRSFRLLLDRNSASSVCIVTHWGVIAAYLSDAIGSGFDDFFKKTRIDNCSINKVSYEKGKALIQCINDTQHLR